MDIELPQDFKEFLKLLNAENAEYLIVGGYAVGYHGYPRATNDMDIWVAVKPENAERLVAALQEFGFDASNLSAEIFLQENQIIRLGVPPMRIEILTGISGVAFDECYPQRVSELIDGIPVNIIDLQNLKLNKKASGRYKDLDDLENLP